MKIDKFVKQQRIGSDHIVESSFEAERLIALGIRPEPFCGYESPIVEKIRHEHRLRNTQEKAYKASREENDV